MQLHIVQCQHYQRNILRNSFSSLHERSYTPWKDFHASRQPLHARFSRAARARMTAYEILYRVG
eukprot:scaffold72318_cov38-Prasinocladus_malaysianus.AAC.1